jgi:Prophage antirepressor
MNAVVRNFGFGEQLVRAVDRDGEAWFVANDVCAALGIDNARQAVSRLDDDERDGVTISDAIGREQETTIVSEPGVYQLVFRSRKPSAKAFKRWLAHEVIPAIRNTGRYEIPRPSNDGGDEAMFVPYLGTADDRDSIRVAQMIIRNAERLYGPEAGRQYWAKLGFPVPSVDLPPSAYATASDPRPQSMPTEGSVMAWAMACGVNPTRRDATHLRECFASYELWAARNGYWIMPVEKFSRSIKTIFGTEEHPEMIRVIITRK